MAIKKGVKVKLFFNEEVEIQKMISNITFEELYADGVIIPARVVFSDKFYSKNSVEHIDITGKAFLPSNAIDKVSMESKIIYNNKSYIIKKIKPYILFNSVHHVEVNFR